MSNNTIKLTIDGKAVEARAGMTVLEAAKSAGIYIPTLCYDEDLKPYGGCRLCVVEIEKMRGYPIACTTPATDGMAVHTDTPAVMEIRRTAMSLILSDHPSQCLVCDRKERCGPFDICLRNVSVTERCVTCPKNDHCELQTIVDYLGIKSIPFRRQDKHLTVDDSNPFYYRDLDKCILCAKCVRVCDEIAGVNAIDIIFRGYVSRIGTLGDKPVATSSCISCGECVAHCPVGALVPKEYVLPDHEVASTCPHCGVGCGNYLGVREGRLVSVRGRREGTVNDGSLCVKGRFGVTGYVNSPDRLQTPLIKKGNGLAAAGWDEALDTVARRLKAFRPEEVAVISSTRCTNEENFLAQKLARAVLGTNNVDYGNRVGYSTAAAGLEPSFGSGAMTNSFTELPDSARGILAIGIDLQETHPVISFKVHRAVANGARLIIVNPREQDMGRWAALWLRPNPDSDISLINAMARIIVDEGLEDKEFIASRCEGYEEYLKSIKAVALKQAERETGVPLDKIARAARLYAATKPAAILCDASTASDSGGADGVIALANLAMLTGSIGKPGAGVNPLRVQCNTQGAGDMGALPTVYPGYQPVTDAAARLNFENAWGVKLPDKNGLALPEVFNAIQTGKIKALYIIEENPAVNEPDASRVRAALDKLEFLAVQDISLTDTARYADVVLAGVSFAEKDGTFTNTERRVQRVRQAIEPVGNSRPDWWIISGLAKRMGGKSFEYSSPADIMAEINRLIPGYGGITYKRLEEKGLQWPCPSEEHPGTPDLHAERFVRGKGRFIPVASRKTAA